MAVVLADIEEPALSHCAEDLAASGARVLPVQTDVSRANDVTALAERTIDHFGSVHILFNNAGVTAPGSIWESSLADWEWVLGVDLWGVIHGVRAFLPIMLKQDTEGHVVNTASGAGLVPRPDMASYTVAKYGIVALSECLHHQLRESDSRIRVSVLCPGAVRTRILDAARNRPAAFRTEVAEALNPDTAEQWQGLDQTVQQAIAPEQIADCAFEAIRENRFYALAHPGLKAQLQLRTDDILRGRDPSRIPR
jgi:NAD(P)-dependent dehydrogenase (short-subunit alcohol dehydrogenase family)